MSLKPTTPRKVSRASLLGSKGWWMRGRWATFGNRNKITKYLLCHHMKLTCKVGGNLVVESTLLTPENLKDSFGRRRGRSRSLSRGRNAGCRSILWRGRRAWRTDFSRGHRCRHGRCVRWRIGTQVLWWGGWRASEYFTYGLSWQEFVSQNNVGLAWSLEFLEHKNFRASIFTHTPGTRWSTRCQT